MADEQATGVDRFQAIAARLQKGDEGSLEEILRDMGPSLVARLRNRFSPLLTPEDIDDVLAQTLFRVWQHRTDYRPALSPFSLWCYLIARNIAIDEVRHKSREKAALSALWNELRGSPAGSEPVDPSPALEALRRVLSEMAPDERETLLASANDEEAWAARMAPGLGLSANALRQRRFRAMSKLRHEVGRLGFASKESQATPTELPKR